MPKKLLAFSLLELLIALSCLTILILNTTPSFKHLLAKNRAYASSIRLMHSLQFAKHSAITSGSNITFCSSNNHRTCSGTWQDGQIIIDAQGQILQVYQALPSSDNLSWHASFGQNTKITFTPYGTTNGIQGSFYYCPKLAEYAYAIIIEYSGKIRLANKTAAGSAIPCKNT